MSTAVFFRSILLSEGVANMPFCATARSATKTKLPPASDGSKSRRADEIASCNAISTSAAHWGVSYGRAIVARIRRNSTGLVSLAGLCARILDIVAWVGCSHGFHPTILHDGSCRMKQYCLRCPGLERRKDGYFNLSNLCIYIYMYICVRVYACICTSTYIYMCMYMYMCSHAYFCKHMYMRKHVIHVFACNMYVRKYTRTPD